MEGKGDCQTSLGCSWLIIYNHPSFEGHRTLESDVTKWRNVECGMWNVECGMGNEEWGMRNGE